MKKRTYAAIIVLVVLLVTGAFSAGFLYSTFIHQKKQPVAKSEQFDFDLLKEVLNDISATYYEKPSKAKMLKGAIDGVVESLDNPYASYYPPKDYDHFKVSMSGNYSGIGVVIGGKKGHIKILKVFEDSPAQKAGLQKGEVIAAVGKKTTAKMGVDQASEIIKGPEGTTVKLTILNGSNKRIVSLVRAKIAFPIVSSKTFEKIGYVNMHFFSQGVSQELKKEILKLQKQGITSLILDLRNNPGGQLSEAVEVGSLFIDKGVIVKTKDKQKEETVYSATGSQIFAGKMVVLVNENTASASEIVSGAIQDRHRGKVVGVKTYGKGTVQQVIPLTNKGALIIPNEIWLTPNGRDITKKGITPDIIIKANSLAGDVQLEKAKALLKN